MTIAPIPSSHRVWAEIDLDALCHNFRLIQQVAAPAKIMLSVKADAYGHGAVPVSKALSAADFLAVATAEEAFQLRRHGLGQPILLLGIPPLELLPRLANESVSLTVSDYDMALRFRQATDGPLAFHLKVDTGVCRLGTPPQEAAAEIHRMMSLPQVTVEGVFSHFAVADDPDQEDFTAGQEAQLLSLRSRLADAPILWHMANSAGMLERPSARLDMVRPGIALYGLDPRMTGSSLSLRPVMALRTVIVRIREVEEGVSVSYGRSWKADGPRRIATVSIGYADGLFRCLSNRMEVLVRGRRAPQVGRICMDMCMLDVTHIPDAAVGDVVTIFGRDGQEEATASQIAQLADTIPYEVLCAVSKRVPRVYLQDGRIVEEALALDAL